MKRGWIWLLVGGLMAVGVVSTVQLPSNPAQQELVMQAKADLSRRLAIEVDRIHLVEVEPVEWPDASLGCPQPGGMYAQVVTPGFRVVLEAVGERYEYHSDARQRVVCCEPQSTRPGSDGGSAEAIELARADLAQRLGLSVDGISVAAVVRQEFPPNAFYCRKAKERVARDASPDSLTGQTILLSAAGHTYEYHASDQTVVFCRQVH